MKCCECGSETEYMNRKHYENETSYGLEYSVKNVIVIECTKDGCDFIAFPHETCQVLDDARNEAEQELIRAYPIGDFITVQEAANMLDVPVRRLSVRGTGYKQRCSRMIYKTKIGKDTFYLKKSVKLFKKHGDGRFNFKGE
jgi:hypothetical protein